MSTTAPHVRPALSSAAVRYVLILCVGLGAVALFLLATVSANNALFAEQYPLLLVLNGAVVLMLTALVVYQLLTLRRKLKSGVFGAKLTLRLVMLFALMAVLPGALIYGVSVQFLARSIESWFQVRVDKALEGGINLGRGALDGLLSDLTAKADAMALELSTLPAAEQPAALSASRARAGVQEATLFSERGKALALSGAERPGLLPELPGPPRNGSCGCMVPTARSKRFPTRDCTCWRWCRCPRAAKPRACCSCCSRCRSNSRATQKRCRPATASIRSWCCRAGGSSACTG